MREPLIRYPIVQHAYVVRDLDESIRHWIELVGAGPFFVSRNHVGRELTYRGTPSQTLVHYAFGQSGDTQVQLIAQDDPGPSIYRDMYPVGEAGLHHIACLVPAVDMPREVARFEAAGFAVASSLISFAETYLPEQGRDLPSIELDHPALEDAHEPTIRRWLNVADVDVVEAAADEVVRLFSEVEGLSPSDVVLLADHEIGVAIMTELRARGNDVISLFTLNDGDARKRLKRAFWAGRPGIKGCTVHSFKGWESRAIVYVPSVMGELLLYIAMTRVKAAPSRSACISVINAVDSLRSFRPRFEREILPSEVPALAGQSTLDV